MRPLSHVLVIGVVAAAVSPDVFAREARRQTVVVGIVLGGHASPGARLVPALVAEADRIWQPRGVAVVRADTSGIMREAVRITLHLGSLSAVRASSSGRKGEGTSGLGSIWFDEDDVPGETITVDDEAVSARLSEVKLNNRPLADWPPAVVDQVLARALGRVLAHELGHFLLRSKVHQTSGLMRSAFSGPDLAAWERTRFALGSNLLPRLRANLARIGLLSDPAVASNRQSAQPSSSAVDTRR
jgi:hypothetical protein